MSKQAWVTPDDLPSAAKCRTVYLPDSIEAESAFWGAYLLLCDPANWETVGTQTAEDIAAEFQTAYDLSLANFGDCP